jgi:hypothetical protein
VLGRRRGEAEEVQRDVADFTASSVGFGGPLQRRTEAAADLCCPAAAERRAAVARVLGTRPGVVAAAYKGRAHPLACVPRLGGSAGETRPRLGLWLESSPGTLQG